MTVLIFCLLCSVLVWGVAKFCNLDGPPHRARSARETPFPPVPVRG